ncbi:MAG: GAF domain-containing protein [Candidatus Hydrogenedens sp.]|nr:GAF domain-containing protein [Candidatus Hydrogenedens sp.]
MTQEHTNGSVDALKVWSEVTSAVRGAKTFNATLTATLDALRESAGLAFAAYWSVAPAEGVLRLTGYSGAPSPDFVQSSQTNEFIMGAGLVGRAWQRGALVSVDDIGQIAESPRASSAQRAGLRGGISFPVTSDGNVIGIVELLTNRPVGGDDPLIGLVQGLSSFVIHTISQAAKLDEASRFGIAIEGSQNPVMMVDRDLHITYANQATKDMVRKNIDAFRVAYPGVNFENLLGTNIDIFHKAPEHQRRILANKNNLPHRAEITVGHLRFALNVTALTNGQGDYVGAQLEWNDITDSVAAKRRAESLFSMIEGASAMFMTCDRNFVINYCNPALKRMLMARESEIKKYLPKFDARNVIGMCIDDFHANPAHQRRLMEDPRNLPAVAEIKVGPLHFQVTATALIDDQGNYIGNAAEWQDLNDRADYGNEVGELIEAGLNGDLKRRGNLDGLSTAYKPMMQGINKILDAVVAPINEAGEILRQVGDRCIDVRITGDYQGDHAAIKENLNSALDAIEEAMIQVRTAAEQVNQASNQIASSSQQLAEGASEQASSLEEISASLEELTSMTAQNADNAQQADGMARESRLAAERGNQATTRMESAINRIKTSSDQTAKIVKTIDEIAFQTNLLALNAAVEAARAGEAGKGFAVVAEEVRNLAVRSAEAAKNTAEMIEDSVKNAEGGVQITNEVSGILKEIVENAEKVSNFISEIAAASKEQSTGLTEINKAVGQMDKVTQTNAANSEETASAAQELASQADSLISVISQFRISGAGGVASHAPARRQVAYSAPPARPAAAKPAASGQSNWQRSRSPEEVIPLTDDDLKDF